MPAKLSGSDLGECSGDDRVERLVHELEVQQLELEMRHNELFHAHVELAKSHDRYQQVFDLAPVGYLTLDRAGRVREANLTAAELLGVERRDLTGRGLSDFMRREQVDLFDRHLQQVFASGTRQWCELALESQPGEHEIPIRVDSMAFPDDEGNRSECRSAIIDLSDLRSAQAGFRAAEAELRRSERQFRQIAEHLEDVLAIIDRASRSVIYASRAFQSIWGRPTSELYAMGGEWLDWIHVEDRKRIEGAYDAFLSNGATFDEECRILRPDNEVRWIRARAFPIAEEDGSVHRDVAVMQDVTTERELEEELRQAQKMEAVGALASGVAHDFNNVLQAILGCVNLARDERTTAQSAREYLDRAANASRRGGELVGQLMAFGRKQKPERRPVAPDLVIESLAPMIDRLVTEQVVVEVDTGSPGWTILGDPVQIEQILMNLAANSRDAMPEGGLLRIRTDIVDAGDPVAKRHGLASADHYLRLVVEDSGTGMSEETRQRIFEPFFTTKEVGKGTGLGLAAVFQVVRQLRGHIDVDSEPGTGTVFTLFFPGQRESVERPVLPAVTDIRFTGRVLLVEDEPIVRMTVRQYLEDLGFEVFEAASGAEALSHCEGQGGRLDLLISDIVLPGTRGPKLAAQVRQHCPGIRVLLMSANPEGLRAVDVELGATPVLKKPFGREDLAARLVELLPGAEPHQTGLPVPRQQRVGELTGLRGGGAARTLMVVEDEEASRQALAALLEIQGYRVLAAAGPSAALALAAEHGEPIDLLLTDLRLPEMAGDELARQLRNSQPGLRVVAMSGLSEAPADVCAFVRKPIDFDGLIAVIERVLAQP